MFRFTIRELLLLTLVAALGVAWWLDHRNMAARQRITEELLIEKKVRAEMAAEQAVLEAEALRTQLEAKTQPRVGSKPTR